MGSGKYDVLTHWPCVPHVINNSHITCPVHVKILGVDHECDNKVVCSVFVDHRILRIQHPGLIFVEEIEPRQFQI